MKTSQVNKNLSAFLGDISHLEYQPKTDQWNEQDILSVICHEIRTPLHSINSMVHLLRANPQVDEQLKCLSNLEFSAKTLMGIVNDVLDYKKIESGRLSLESTPFSITELVGDIRHYHLARAEEKEIKLKFRLDADLPKIVVGDSSRLRQILNNLISNAVKFTHSGCVWVDVEVQESSFKNVTLAFKVKDTGVGISIAEQHVLFSPFVQGSNENTRQFGSGLGLYITKSLVTMQSGKLQFKSKEGIGTCVTASIPYELPPDEKQKDDTNKVEFSILVAEDNKINAFLSKKVLEKWGMDVDVTETGRQTVDQVLTKHYDLVLMDLQLPDIDGFEAFRLIRDAGFSDLPVIAYSASADPKDKEMAMDLGMEAYIEKPFSPPALRSKIEEIIMLKAKNTQ